MLIEFRISSNLLLDFNLRLNSTNEFTSKAFYDYCAYISIRITIELSLAHTCTQNSLYESSVKKLLFIAGSCSHINFMHLFV